MAGVQQRPTEERHLGRARQNTCIQAATRNFSGRKHPPTTRGISRDEPLPPDGFQIRGGRRDGGFGVGRGGGGVRGFAGVCPRWRSGLAAAGGVLVLV